MPNFFSDLIGAVLDSVNKLLQDELEYIVDLLFGTILTVPRIETEGPLTFGRPDGQPLSAIGDFLTPSLFNTIAAESYEYVWVGAGGSLTVTALVMYLGMIMLSGQYEMLQFDTSQKKAKNPIVGFLLIIFWFPLYLLIIALSHGFVHAFVTVEQIVEVIASVMAAIISGIGVIAGAASLGPAGAVIGLLVILLMIIIAILTVLPYIFLVVIMVARSLFMGVYLLFAPFLIAGSWSGLPLVSKTCDKLLWKSIVVAVIPVVMVPVLYVTDLMFLPLFSGISSEASGAAVASGVGGIDVGFSGAIAFAILGYGLLVSVWVGFSKISPATQKVGQTLLRSGVAAGIVGFGSQLGVEADKLSRTAEITVRVGAMRGMGVLASGYLLNRQGSEGGGESDDGSRGDNNSDSGGDSGGEYDREYEDGTFDGDNWRNEARSSQAGETDPVSSEPSREYTTPEATEPDTDGYDLETLRNNLILNPEDFDPSHFTATDISEIKSPWKEDAEISRIRAKEIAARLDEEGVEVDVFDRNPEEYMDLPTDKPQTYGQPAKYAVMEVWKEEYSSGKNVRLGNQTAKFELIDSPVDTESSTVDQPTSDDDLIHDPVDAAFETDQPDDDSDYSTPGQGDTDSESSGGSDDFEDEYDDEYDSREDGFNDESYGEDSSTSRRYNESEATDSGGDDAAASVEEEIEESDDGTQTQENEDDFEDEYDDEYDSSGDQYKKNYNEDTATNTAERHEEEASEDPHDEIHEDENVADGHDDSESVGVDPDGDNESSSETDTQSTRRGVQLGEKRREEFYRIQQALKMNSGGDTSPASILAEAGAEPNVWLSAVSDAIGADNPGEAISIPDEIRSD